MYTPVLCVRIYVVGGDMLSCLNIDSLPLKPFLARTKARYRLHSLYLLSLSALSNVDI